ncbi:hypothetical protein BS47DRAFT_1338303 [Hydnum rufescens UP504]|uniref:Uncharacterized protein n=1 Tax=Hydnum rufescens UP504 TaxID=1448309 RepID=A0A9P6B6M1_9AGAM|nr:hypothetical protein BS47DRAFT_1338303 [Hydnum rufescens UP504]
MNRRTNFYQGSTDLLGLGSSTCDPPTKSGGLSVVGFLECSNVPEEFCPYPVKKSSVPAQGLHTVYAVCSRNA